MTLWLNSLGKAYALLAVTSSYFEPWFGNILAPNLSSPQASPIISNGVQEYIGDLVGKFNVSGLALTVVRPDGEVEYGSWGNRTEDGDKVTPEVSLSSVGAVKHIENFIDSLHPRVVFKSIRLSVYGHSNRRFRQW